MEGLGVGGMGGMGSDAERAEEVVLGVAGVVVVVLVLVFVAPVLAFEATGALLPPERTTCTVLPAVISSKTWQSVFRTTVF